MTKDEIAQLDQVLTIEGGLSIREINFVENLDNNYRDKPLTWPQEKWLGDIADRISPK